MNHQNHQNILTMKNHIKTGIKITALIGLAAYGTAIVFADCFGAANPICAHAGDGPGTDTYTGEYACFADQNYTVGSWKYQIEGVAGRQLLAAPHPCLYTGWITIGSSVYKTSCSAGGNYQSPDTHSDQCWG